MSFSSTPANQILRSRDIGYRQAMPIIQKVKANVNAMRNDKQFGSFFQAAEETLESLEYVPLRSK